MVVIVLLQVVDTAPLTGTEPDRGNDKLVVRTHLECGTRLHTFSSKKKPPPRRRLDVLLDSDGRRHFLPTQRVVQSREEFGECHHHQHERGVSLSQGILSPFLGSLLLKQLFELQAPDHKLVVQDERQFVLPGQRQLGRDLASGQVIFDFVAGEILPFTAN